MQTIIQRKHCHTYVGASKTTFWRMEQQPDFPKKIRLSERTVGYRIADLNAWLESRQAGEAAQ